MDLARCFDGPQVRAAIARLSYPDRALFDAVLAAVAVGSHGSTRLLSRASGENMENAWRACERAGVPFGRLVVLVAEGLACAWPSGVRAAL